LHFNLNRAQLVVVTLGWRVAEAKTTLQKHYITDKDGIFHCFSRIGKEMPAFFVNDYFTFLIKGEREHHVHKANQIKILFLCIIGRLEVLKLINGEINLFKNRSVALTDQQGAA
jgi:hypothetical protein